MEKLPGTFSKMFVREGVVHAIDTLILAGSQNAVSVQPSSNEKDNDSIIGTSRSRRFRKRGGNPNPDENSLGEPKTYVSVTIGSPPICAPILHPRGCHFWRESVTHHKKGLFLHAKGIFFSTCCHKQSGCILERVGAQTSLYSRMREHTQPHRRITPQNIMLL